MKFIAFMNGWTESPKHWHVYLFKKPFKYESNPAWRSISILGFVFFFEADKEVVAKYLRGE